MRARPATHPPATRPPATRPWRPPPIEAARAAPAGRATAAALAVLVLALARAHAAGPCRTLGFEQNTYTVCDVDLTREGIRLFWKRPDGAPYGRLDALPHALPDGSGPLVFATNAGMFDAALRPIGLYVEAGAQLVAANTKSGWGNFHWKPNGVFFVAGERAAVLETGAYLRLRPRPEI